MNVKWMTMFTAMTSQKKIFGQAWLIDLIVITVLGLCSKTSKLNLWPVDGAIGLILGG